MVQIIYDQAAGAVTVTGHAGAGEHGQDLICAAVSTLVCTLAEDVRQMEAQGMVSAASMDIRPGDCHIAWTAAVQARDLVRAMLETVILGLACVARDHPDHAAFTVG